MARTHYLESGIDNFGMNQLDAAMYEFKHAEIGDPRNPLVHYYMASVLSRQNKLEDAKDEYQKALSFSLPTSQVAQLCRAAIANIDKQLMSLQKQALKNGTPSGSETPGPRTSSLDSDKMTPLKNSPVGLPQKAENQNQPVGRMQRANENDPDMELLKATGGIPRPLLPGGDEHNKKSNSIGTTPTPGTSPLAARSTKTTKAQDSKVSSSLAESTETLSAETVEKECREIQAKMRKRVNEMQNAKVHGENGDVYLYSPEDMEDVQAQADALCESLRKRIAKTAASPAGRAAVPNPAVTPARAPR